MAKRTTKFELPCGYVDSNEDLHTSVTIVELDHKTDKAVASGMTSTELVANHVVEIGSIKDRSEIEEAVPKLEKGDFDWILIQLRILSLGSEYTYPQICPNTRCNFQGEYVHDLEEIEVIDAPDPRQREIEYVSDEDHVLVFRTLKAQDMQDLAELMKDPEDQITRILALQLVSIDGVTPAKALSDKGRKCKNASQRVRQAIAMMDKIELPHREKEAIRKEIRKVIGYADRRVRGVCPECGTNFGHLLPIDYTFIVPSLEEVIQHGSL